MAPDAAPEYLQWQQEHRTSALTSSFATRQAQHTISTTEVSRPLSLNPPNLHLGSVAHPTGGVWCHRAALGDPTEQIHALLLILQAANPC